jgi:cholesterol oxidase
MMSASEREQSTRAELDFDWVVVGSGFGGSVSALRLAEKGYSVTVLECGSRFEDDDFAESTLRQPRRYFFAPKLGLRGVLRLTFFKDVFVVSGSGVGGGSLGYANTLYRARPAFFNDPQWADLADWQAELQPHYDTAERMLGVVEYEGIGPADQLLRNTAKRSASATPSRTRGSASSSIGPASRSRTPSSKARARSGRAACAAEAAWSAAGTAPRTR